ncbi:MAG TPA: OsmC family protein [Gemmatimonadaceae bacterium]|nr:OsmC family protein [Gemmatimonadaceae bacterium]
MSAEHATKAGALASAPATREPNRVRVEWQGDHRFDAGRPGGPVARIDSDAATGQSPVDALLSALATCVSVDVVDILKKRRTPPSRYEVEVVGTRVDATPRRLKHVLLRFFIDGEGIEPEQAERAVQLAVTKYCSVRDSLDPDLPVEWEVHVNDGL